jgi:predicted site-specific integrase-resolvase
VTQLAERLNIPTKWIHTQLRRGAIRAIHEPSGRYLFPDTDHAMLAIRQLREHHIKTVDLTGGSP